MIHMHFARPLSAIVLASSLVACSSDGGPGSVGGGDGSVDGACRAYATDLRGYYTRCGAGLQMSAARWDAYLERLRLACVSLLQVEGLTYTPTQFNECTRGIFSSACGTKTDDIAACNFPVGTLANSTACASSDQCQSGYCAKPRSDTGSPSTCGTCQPRIAIGGVCQTSAGCVEGAVCESATSKCAARTVSDVGGPCDLSNTKDCKAGLYCDYAAKTCKARGDIGATCTSTTQCKLELRCDSTTKTCRAPVVAKEGEACGSTTSATCGDGLTCDSATTKCVKITFLAPGATCGAPLTRCERGSCHPTLKKCPLIIADGGTCMSDQSTGICDDLASCVDGKCIFAGQVVCK